MLNRRKVRQVYYFLSRILKKVEKDIERQEAISDYLYEQEDIPELNDIFEENDNFTEDDVDKYAGTSLQKGIYQVMNELGLWCTV